MATGTLNHQRAKHVSKLVQEGKALAIGFNEGAKQPVEIPAYLFDTDDFIKWGKNEIQGNGHRYISVKIVKLEKSERSPRKKHKPSAKKAPVGRPGSNELKDIIDELKREPGFDDLPGKSKIAKIAQIAFSRHPNKYSGGKGISQATIYRYLRAQ